MDGDPFVAFSSGHVCLKAGTDCYYFICPKHGQMEGLMPEILTRMLVAELTCALCSRAIGKRIHDHQRTLGIVNQIISSSLKTYSLGIRGTQ